MGRRLLPFTLACLLAAGCGSRSDYELQELRRLAAGTVPGDDISSLLALEASLPADAAGPIGRSRLLIAARMSSLGFPPRSLGPLLKVALDDPADAFQKLGTDHLSLSALRQLSAAIQSGRGGQAAADLPPDFNLLTAAGQMLAGLALAKKGDHQGLAEVIEALEFLAAAEGALPPHLVTGAATCLARLDRVSGSRSSALATLLEVQLTP